MTSNRVVLVFWCYLATATLFIFLPSLCVCQTEVSSSPSQSEQPETIRIALLGLEAQQEVAKYNKLLYYVTASGLIVGAITIFCLFANIRQTKAIFKSSRAWMTPGKRLNVKPHVDGIAILFEWLNSGLTPAKNLKLSSIALTPILINGAECFENPDPKGYEKEESFGIVGAGSSAPYYIVVPNKYKESVINEGLTLRIFLKVRYSTVYNGRHTTLCCYDLSCSPNLNEMSTNWTFIFVGDEAQIS